MAIKAGDIIRVPANFVKPVKPKYLICVCSKDHYYMVINTEPYRLAANAQLMVTVNEVPALEHTSHIDTSKLIRLTKMETVNVVEADARCHKGSLSVEILSKILDCVANHGIMPGHQVKLVMQNLKTAR